MRRGPRTRVVDLDGRALLPGLIDPHMHFVFVQFDDWIDVSAITTPSDDAVMAKLRDGVRTARPGAWVRAQGFDPSITRGARNRRFASSTRWPRTIRSSCSRATATSPTPTARPCRSPRSRVIRRTRRQADTSATPTARSPAGSRSRRRSCASCTRCRCRRPPKCAIGCAGCSSGRRRSAARRCTIAGLACMPPRPTSRCWPRLCRTSRRSAIAACWSRTDGPLG